MISKPILMDILMDMRDFYKTVGDVADRADLEDYDSNGKDFLKSLEEELSGETNTPIIELTLDEAAGCLEEV